MEKIVFKDKEIFKKLVESLVKEVFNDKKIIKESKNPMHNEFVGDLKKYITEKRHKYPDYNEEQINEVSWEGLKNMGKLAGQKIGKGIEKVKAVGDEFSKEMTKGDIQKVEKDIMNDMNELYKKIVKHIKLQDKIGEKIVSDQILKGLETLGNMHKGLIKSKVK